MNKPANVAFTQPKTNADLSTYSQLLAPLMTENQQKLPLDPHLKALENEAIYIFREVVAEFTNPVMLYSVGKDSSVLLHLARKAFYPDKIPFPLLHIDTGWKFKDMIKFRDEIVIAFDLDLISYTNPRGNTENITPFNNPQYTDIMKTDTLKTALDKGGFDAAFGGARRDEEASRAKERIYSFRTENHTWDPRNQRPELWSIYNGDIRKGESVRAFPLSNWTEVDIWNYIKAENIPLVPLYFSKRRSFVERNDMMILAEDERLELLPGEKLKTAELRFRTLGCFPLTGAIRSKANSLDAIIDEIQTATVSERQGRAIDRDKAGSMEMKKREGYF
jgi:sulfate adenylyltransferase subunit 2